MGAGMARRAARGGHDVVAWNRTESVAAEVAAEPDNGGRIGVAEPLERLVEMMSAPRHVVVSVPSGDATDRMIAQLVGILEPGDVVIDAGNSRFHDSRRHAAELAERGLEWLDMGVSGGIWGLEVGFCAMLGGKREAFERFEPVVKTLAPEGGYLYCGPAGAGHYVKMVHNGIEYGIMQAYGEGFDILHAADYDLDLAAIAEMWNHGSVIRSWLLELAARAFAREGNDLESISGWVADSGEGRWTVAEAIDHDVPAPVITLSLIERFRSRRSPDSYTDRVLAALRNEFGGHAIKARE
jgi:6-phosphogluconate dehydrogenase